MSGELTKFAGELSKLTGLRFDAAPSARVHGGCINEAYRWETQRQSVFVKVAAAESLPMLEAEAEGLEDLRGVRAVRVPQVLAVGSANQKSFIALEWIELGRPEAAGQAQLGEQLALQHRNVASEFGWQRGNFIGRTPQANERTPDWVEFLGVQRLRPQLELARQNGFTGRLQEEGAELLECLPDLLHGHRPEPSLLHGDLWGGNWGVDSDGRPVIFDPAVYYGDREADIAMTQLFGGFGSAFYRAYGAAWPLAKGADERVDLYNLYHVLNHLNLFGRGYLHQAYSILARLRQRRSP